jgi:hypothetical protein
MSVIFIEHVRFAGLLWLKVLFAGLLWEKNTAGWLLILLICSKEQGDTLFNYYFVGTIFNYYFVGRCSRFNKPVIFIHSSKRLDDWRSSYLAHTYSPYLIFFCQNNSLERSLSNILSVPTYLSFSLSMKQLWLNIY